MRALLQHPRSGAAAVVAAATGTFWAAHSPEPPPDDHEQPPPILLPPAPSRAADTHPFRPITRLAWADPGPATTEADTNQLLSNWSRTHRARVGRRLPARDEHDVAEALRAAERAGQRVRVVGSALSPNGLSLPDNEGWVVSVAGMNRVLEVDAAARTARVQCGATVGATLAALAQHGLTLENLASIDGQQLGGFTQVGAHGTGARLPPVDEQVVAMTLVTPALGTIRLSRDEYPELFSLAKVGLGSLGVVVDVTLRCVDAHRLRERVELLTRAEARARCGELVSSHQHARYMWIPHTKAVVAVYSDPMVDGDHPSLAETVEEVVEPMLALLPTEAARRDARESGASIADVRDALLVGKQALDPSFVARVNAAESACYRAMHGRERAAPSDQVLGFDCGGAQWVLEMAMPCGRDADHPDLSDVAFVERLLERIEELGVPAPAPIEHRWTRSSSSAMSPVANAADPDRLWAWVGVVMYVDEALRDELEEAFTSYARLAREVAAEMGLDTRTHWAKLEIGEEDPSRWAPLARWREAKRVLDPHGVLGNAWCDEVLGGL